MEMNVLASYNFFYIANVLRNICEETVAYT